MITKDQVKHIAKLARIGITEEEIEKFQGDLALILDYVGQLQEVGVENVDPLSQAVGITNVTRADNVEACDTKVINKMIDQAPDKKSGWIKVKSIL